MTSFRNLSTIIMNNNTLIDLIKQEVITALTKHNALSLDQLITECLSAETRLMLIKGVKAAVDAGEVIKKPCGLYRLATEVDRLAAEVTQEIKTPHKRMKLSGVKVIRPNTKPLSTHAVRQYYDSAIIEQSEMLMTLFGLKSDNTAAFSRNSVIGRLAYLFYIYRDRVVFEKDFNELLAEPVQNYKTALDRLVTSGIIQERKEGYQWTGKVRYPFQTRTDHEESILKSLPNNYQHGFPSTTELAVKHLRSKVDKHTYGDKEMAVAHRLFTTACKEIRQALVDK